MVKQHYHATDIAYMWILLQPTSIQISFMKKDILFISYCVDASVVMFALRTPVIYVDLHSSEL